MSKECVFCRIIGGTLPSCKVFEDDDTIAFMDINPVTKGHTLVIPKSHHESIMDTPADVLEKVIVTARKIAIAQKKALNAAGINVTQANGALAGQIIGHIHFHVIPRFENDNHSWSRPQGKYDRDDEMESFADRIRNDLE